MSITQLDTTTPRREADPMSSDVTTLPVADVDRAKAFYQRLGQRLDITFEPAPDLDPGSAQGVFLDVDDIEATRDELIGRGVDVSEIWHIEPGEGRAPGLDPQRRSYLSRASFADPDGNTWVLEEITERLPGRAEMRHSGALAQLLFEAAKRHGAFAGEDTPHDWWDWYAAYMDARHQGSIQEEAATVAGRYIAAVKHIAASA
jgi:catechol 2,3-dioxygenase-like lactoylglutathione lyase family enzyme